jgi:glucosyl-3-phosphoglycerate synthase
MSDFAQTGLICTLQRLNDAHLPRIEGELVELAQDRPIALVLPCHGADLEKAALAGIVAELQDAAFLREIVITLNGVDEFTFALAQERFARMPQKVTLLWNDRPGAPASALGGKGGNVAAALAHLTAGAGCEFIDLARLCYAVAHPQLGYRFAKMYYSRVTDRLYGRVSRLFLAPLLYAVVRVAGHVPLVDFLLSFRYPLAGEVAMTRELATSLRPSAGWGWEIGQLCNVFRQVDPREVCQVDGGSGYDHKHQPAATALAGMAEEIARELFAQLATEGLANDAGFRAAVARGYRSEAMLALRRSASLAQINGLPFDGAEEAAIVEAFAARLEAA